MNVCLICGKELNRQSYKYCSNRCQSVDRYNQYILTWKSGLTNGSRGINARNISNYIRRYMLNKFGEKCVLCGWKKINPASGKVVLEVDHINGDSEDNREENLRLVCPNCHSLSPNYKNLNKGKGRGWRREKYLKKGSPRVFEKDAVLQKKLTTVERKTIPLNVSPREPMDTLYS